MALLLFQMFLEPVRTFTLNALQNLWLPANYEVPFNAFNSSIWWRHMFLTIWRHYIIDSKTALFPEEGKFKFHHFNQLGDFELQLRSVSGNKNKLRSTCGQRQCSEAGKRMNVIVSCVNQHMSVSDISQFVLYKS